MLEADVTLADVVATLSNAERYVRKALQNMHAVRKAHGDVVLRIGRTGVGHVPHYRIDSRSEGFDFEGSPRERLIPVAAFNGRNHAPLANVPEGEEVDILRDNHWSDGSMSYCDVQALLGQVCESSKRRR